MVDSSRQLFHLLLCFLLVPSKIQITTIYRHLFSVYCFELNDYSMVASFNVREKNQYLISIFLLEKYITS